MYCDFLSVTFFSVTFFPTFSQPCGLVDIFYVFPTLICVRQQFFAYISKTIRFSQILTSGKSFQQDEIYLWSFFWFESDEPCWSYSILYQPDFQGVGSYFVTCIVHRINSGLINLLPFYFLSRHFQKFNLNQNHNVIANLHNAMLLSNPSDFF